MKNSWSGVCRKVMKGQYLTCCTQVFVQFQLDTQFRFDPSAMLSSVNSLDHRNAIVVCTKSVLLPFGFVIHYNSGKNKMKFLPEVPHVAICYCHQLLLQISIDVCVKKLLMKRGVRCKIFHNSICTVFAMQIFLKTYFLI